MIRKAGETGEGIIGTVFNDWLNIEGSPATLILAIILLLMMFVAPFGIVGLLRRLARRFVVIVPRPAGHPIDATHLLATTEAAAEVEGVDPGRRGQRLRRPIHHPRRTHMKPRSTRGWSPRSLPPSSSSPRAVTTTTTAPPTPTPHRGERRADQRDHRRHRRRRHDDGRHHRRHQRGETTASTGGSETTTGDTDDGGGGSGWTVDTEDCVDPDRANAPIEGTISIGSSGPLSGGPAAAAFAPVIAGFQAYIDYANEQGLMPGPRHHGQLRRRPVRPGRSPLA